MSWSDLFYPDNPKRRNEVVRLCTKLYNLIESNFKSTNRLIDVMHEFLPGKKFKKIYIQSEDSVKTNVNMILERIGEIQDYIEKKNEKLREMIEPTLYEKLVSTGTSFQGKIAIAKSLTTKALAVIGSVASVALLGSIYQGKIFVDIVAKLGKVGTATLASLALSVLVIGIDMIASAIIGAVEKSNLTAAIDELEKTLQEFEPESEDFNRSIQRVQIYLEEHA